MLADSCRNVLYSLCSYLSEAGFRCSVALLCCCISISLVFSGNSGTLSSADLLILSLTDTIIDPLRNQRQTSHSPLPSACLQLLFTSTDFFRSSVASWIQNPPNNNSNYNPSTLHGIEPLPLLFSHSPWPVSSACVQTPIASPWLNSGRRSMSFWQGVPGPKAHCLSH